MKKKNILVVGKNSKIAQSFLKEKIEHATIIATDRSSLDLMSSESIDLFIKQNKNMIFDAVIFFASIYDEMESKIDMQNIKKHLDVHFFGPLTVLGKINVSKGAKVIFLCDSGLIQPKKKHFGYSFSKSLLHEFIRHLAVDFAPDISIIGINLGPIVTDKKGEAQKKFNQKSLIQVRNPAQGLVHLIRFIIHENNFYMSGQIIPFDGGTYINRQAQNNLV